MMTINIKVDGKLVESIDVSRPAQKIKDNEYIVNGIYSIEHDKERGHRELARLALEAIKKAV